MKSGLIRLYACQMAALLLFAINSSAQDLNQFPQSNEKRVALVIGNADYRAAPLRNPVNDARDMASKLQKLDFEVIARFNLNTRQIGSALREFKSKLSPGSVALFFYAGHGLQIKGENYLPTVDAEISSEEDVPNQSLSTKQIMGVLDDSKTRLNLVFLDACRDNPFARSFRSSGGGLAKLDAPSGTLISYATRPGSVAADGNGRNGLYTENLLKVMDVPNMPIEQALKRVVSSVKRESGGRQEPWMEGSIEGDFYFSSNVLVAPDKAAGISTAAVNVPLVSPQRKADIDDESLLWSEVKNSGSKDHLGAYLSQYPNGKYAALAKIELNKISTSNVPPNGNKSLETGLNSSEVKSNTVSEVNDGFTANKKYAWNFMLYPFDVNSGPSQPGSKGVATLEFDGHHVALIGNGPFWGINPCIKSKLRASAQQTSDALIIDVPPETRGCDHQRIVVKKDGSGGVREIKVNGQWGPDGFDRLLTAKK